MKNLLLSAIIFSCFHFISCETAEPVSEPSSDVTEVSNKNDETEDEIDENATDETTEVPGEILEKFDATHPAATNVAWSNDEENYEVDFEFNGMEFSILYDAEGNILESEKKLIPEELPESIQSYLANNHADIEIQDAEMKENEDGIFYEVDLDGDVDLLFDSEGNIIDRGEQEDDAEEEEED